MDMFLIKKRRGSTSNEENASVSKPKAGVSNLSPTMRQLFIIRFQMRQNLHKSWRKYFPPMSRFLRKQRFVCSCKLRVITTRLQCATSNHAMRHLMAHAPQLGHPWPKETAGILIVEESSAKSKKPKTEKPRLYNAEYLIFGFTFAGNANNPRPQCLICGDILANESMVPNKVKPHLSTNHSNLITKPVEYFVQL